MVNADDPSIRTWLLSSKETTPIHIVSEVWNVRLLAVGIPALGVLFSLLVLSAIMIFKRGRSQGKTYQPVGDSDSGFEGFEIDFTDSNGGNE